jgi:hypothetical protein
MFSLKFYKNNVNISFRLLSLLIITTVFLTIINLLVSSFYTAKEDKKLVTIVDGILSDLALEIEKYLLLCDSIALKSNLKKGKVLLLQSIQPKYLQNVEVSVEKLDENHYDFISIFSLQRKLPLLSLEENLTLIFKFDQNATNKYIDQLIQNGPVRYQIKTLDGRVFIQSKLFAGTSDIMVSKKNTLTAIVAYIDQDYLDQQKRKKFGIFFLVSVFELTILTFFMWLNWRIFRLKYFNKLDILYRSLRQSEKEKSDFCAKLKVCEKSRYSVYTINNLLFLEYKSFFLHIIKNNEVDKIKSNSVSEDGKHEIVLNDLIHTSVNYWAEEISNKNIMVQFHYDEIVVIKCHNKFIFTMMLVNIIGLVLILLTKNKKLLISIKPDINDVIIKISDNGFGTPITEASQYLFEGSVILSFKELSWIFDYFNIGFSTINKIGKGSDIEILVKKEFQKEEINFNSKENIILFPKKRENKWFGD